MEKVIKDHTGTVLSRYEGIVELDLRTMNVLHMSDPKMERVLVMVHNEDMIDYWLIDPLNQQKALDELHRYYAEEESWVDLKRPGNIQVFRMTAVELE